MRKFSGRIMKWIVVLLFLGIPFSAQAAGLYLYELGMPEVGLAGAGWAARAQDAATVFTNPAGMVRLDRSDLMVGIQPLYVNIDFDADQNTTATGKDGDASTWLPTGGTYYVHNLNPDLKLGVAVNGYFGLGLDYGDDWVGRYYVDETKLQAMSVQPALAYRVNNWLSIGMGVNVLYAVFEKTAAVNNVDPGLPDGKLKVEDKDWAYQLNLGLLVEPWKGTRFGLTYLSEGDLEFDDRPEFSGLGPGLNTILGNSGLLNARLDLDMTMPQSLMFSVYHDMSDKLAVMGNLGWQEWSEFGMVGVTVSAENTTSLTADRRYDDTWHAALGFQYRVSEPWRLSAGAAYDSAMVDEKDMTPDVVSGEQWRFGLGAQYDWSEKLTVGCAYALVWTGDLDMDVNRGPLAGRVSGTYEETAMHFININLIWKF
ncbi:MAG TPA: transporter [Desulfobacterales bacterium]|nr:transporter [Desulfobacterales bacterium]